MLIKIIISASNGSSVVVKHSMRNPKIEGSIPSAGTGIELSCEREKKKWN